MKVKLTYKNGKIELPPNICFKDDELTFFVEIPRGSLTLYKDLDEDDEILAQVKHEQQEFQNIIKNCLAIDVPELSEKQKERMQAITTRRDV